jgi:hypothetical protein
VPDRTVGDVHWRAAAAGSQTRLGNELPTTVLDADWPETWLATWRIDPGHQDGHTGKDDDVHHGGADGRNSANSGEGTRTSQGTRMKTNGTDTSLSLL